MGPSSARRRRTSGPGAIGSSLGTLTRDFEVSKLSCEAHILSDTDRTATSTNGDARRSLPGAELVPELGRFDSCRAHSLPSLVSQG